MKSTGGIEPAGGAPKIGVRLRDARLRQGLTIENVANLTGLTKGFLSRLERDMTSPSVATLVTLCEALSIPIGELFASARADLVRAADAPQVQFAGSGVDERLLTPREESRLQMLRSTIDPGAGGGAELYTLNARVEVLHVLSGELDLTFADGTHRLRAGDTMTFSGREPHTWVNPTDERVEAFWIITPAPWSRDDSGGTRS